MPAAVITNVYKVSDNGTIALIHVDGTNLGASQNGSTVTFFGAAVTVTHWENTYIEFETSLSNVEMLIKNFTDLADVPQNYTDAGGKTLKVKSTTDGVEFVAETVGSSGSGISDVLLEEYVDANTVLQLWSNGKVRKHINSSASTLNVATLTAFPEVSAISPLSVYVGGSRTLLFYVDGTTSGNPLKMSVIDNIDTAPSITGTYTVANNVTPAEFNFDAAVIGSDSVAVSFSSQNDGYLYMAKITSVSTTPQIGEPFIAAAASATSGQIRMTCFAEGCAAVGFYNGSYAEPYVVLVKNILTTPAPGTPMSLSSTTWSSDVAVAYVGGDRIVAVFKDYTSKDAIMKVISSASTAPVLSGPTTVYVGQANYIGVVCIGLNSVAVVCVDYDSSYRGYVTKVSNVDATPSVGTPLSFAPSSQAFSLSAYYTGTNTLLIGFRDGLNSYKPTFNHVTDLDTTPSATTPQAVMSSNMATVHTISAVGVYPHTFVTGGPNTPILTCSLNSSPSKVNLAVVLPSATDTGDRFVSYFSGNANTSVPAQKLGTDYSLFTVNGVTFSAGNSVYIGTDSRVQSAVNGTTIGKAVNASTLLIKKP